MAAAGRAGSRPVEIQFVRTREQHALVAPDQVPAVHAALESALVGSREEWDLCELVGLPAGATLLKLAPGHAWKASTQVLDSHPDWN